MKLKKLLFLPLAAIIPAVVAPAILSSCSLADPDLYDDITVNKDNKDQLISRCNYWLSPLAQKEYEANQYEQLKSDIRSSIGNPYAVLYYEILYFIANKIAKQEAANISLTKWTNPDQQSTKVDKDWNLPKVSGLSTPLCSIEVTLTNGSKTTYEIVGTAPKIVENTSTGTELKSLAMNFTYKNQETKLVEDLVCHKFEKVSFKLLTK